MWTEIQSPLEGKGWVWGLPVCAGRLPCSWGLKPRVCSPEDISVMGWNDPKTLDQQHIYGSHTTTCLITFVDTLTCQVLPWWQNFSLGDTFATASCILSLVANVSTVRHYDNSKHITITLVIVSLLSLWRRQLAWSLPGSDVILCTTSSTCALMLYVLRVQFTIINNTLPIKSDLLMSKTESR